MHFNLRTGECDPPELIDSGKWMHYRVYLDGQEPMKYFAANEEKDEVLCCHTDRGGRILSGPLQRQEFIQLKGQVTFVFDPELRDKYQTEIWSKEDIREGVKYFRAELNPKAQPNYCSNQDSSTHLDGIPIV